VHVLHRLGLIALALLIVPAYLYARSLLIMQEPSGDVVVSNLTLNLVMVGMIMGGMAPWIQKRFFPTRKWMYVPILLIIVVIFLTMLVAGGYHLRFIGG
jgi:hypothetical protein